MEEQEGQVVDGEVQAEPQPPPEPPKIDPHIEERARMQGWMPKEEFRGDPGRWIPAEKFVARADEMMPILKSVNAKLETKLTTLEKQLSEQKAMTEKMVKIQTKYTTDQYDQRLAELKAKKREAAQAGDLTLYDNLDQQERTISRPEPLDITPDEPSAPPLHPDVVAWQSRNSSWYGSDPELTEFSDIIAERVHKSWQGRTYSPSEFLGEVERKVKAMFPTKFTNPNQRRSDMDESGLRGGDNTQATNGKKGWNDLPQDAKKQCSALIAQIPGYTKEKYIKDFFEGE